MQEQFRQEREGYLRKNWAGLRETAIKFGMVPPGVEIPEDYDSVISHPNEDMHSLPLEVMEFLKFVKICNKFKKDEWYDPRPEPVGNVGYDATFSDGRERHKIEFKYHNVQLGFLWRNNKLVYLEVDKYRLMRDPSRYVHYYMSFFPIPGDPEHLEWAYWRTGRNDAFVSDGTKEVRKGGDVYHRDETVSGNTSGFYVDDAEYIGTKEWGREV